MNSYQKSLLRENSSAVAYAPLVFTDGEFVPTENRLFCGLYIAPDTETGDIEIEGVDGVSAILTLTSGYWPLGGAKILEENTSISAGAVTVLF